jgi:TorA maturation chaperone TorD
MSEGLASDLAREVLYRFLAAALSNPRGSSYHLVQDPNSQRLAAQSADLLREEASGAVAVRGFGELGPEQLDLAPLLQKLREPVVDRGAEYERVFGVVFSKECPPYETEYHTTTDVFFRSQQLADIAGFYRAFGLDVSDVAPERVDHLTLELEFMAFLLLKKRLALTSTDGNPHAAEQSGVCEDAQRNFFRDHLAWWVPSFVAGLRRKADGDFYGAIGQVLGALLPLERGRFGVAAPRLPLQPALIERPEEQSGGEACIGQA